MMDKLIKVLYTVIYNSSKILRPKFRVKNKRIRVTSAIKLLKEKNRNKIKGNVQ